MEEYQRVAKVSEINPGERKIVNVNGKSVAIFNLNGEFFAIENRCTHMEAELGRGELHEDIIKCPWHGWRFNVKDGSCTSASTAKSVPTFKVKVEEDNIKVKVDALPEEQFKIRYPFIKK